MITIDFTPIDLLSMRFAYRPLLEIALSYRVWRNPGFQGPYRRWLNDVRPALDDLEFPYLSALVSCFGYIPDFLTPTPLAAETDVEADLEALLATPDALVHAGVSELVEKNGGSALREFFMAHPREALPCLVEEMRLYWQRALAPHWSHMVSALEGDILYRARTLALDGPGPVLGDLHESITFQHYRINIQPDVGCQPHHETLSLTLDGGGIHLVPLVFKGCGRSYQVAPAWQPMLAYGIRGGLWSQTLPGKSLEYALGAVRAQVLQNLATPATTTELAHRMHLTAGAVSIHLSRLVKAGLIEPRRSGKRVYYHLTRRGADLLDLFDGSG